MYGDIKFAISCEQCGEKGEAKIWCWVDYMGKVLTTLTEKKFELPAMRKGWQ